jgi:hypothetical protein
MKQVVGWCALSLVLLAGCSSMPGAPGADEHAAHRLPGAAAGAPSPAQHEHQMKMMQEMHQKMAAAKTPEERAALMRDHRKAMHDGMAMMGRMRGGMMGGGKGPMSMDAEMMKRRMDMMEMMMQMMLDREGMSPPAGK